MANISSQSVHVVPLNDLIWHPTNGENCPCGPTVDPVQHDDGTITWNYVHHALDGRE